jgi:hypothetical protein
LAKKGRVDMIDISYKHSACCKSCHSGLDSPSEMIKLLLLLSLERVKASRVYTLAGAGVSTPGRGFK